MTRGVVAATTAQLVGACLALTSSPPGSRLAYIDPGSGSLVLQIVASFFVGLLFYLRTVRRFFATVLARLRRRDSGSKSDSQE
jgi:hypothetical protein